MSEATAWGALLTAYIVPFAAWLIYEQATHGHDDTRTHAPVLWWAAGMVVLFGLWRYGFPPALLILAMVATGLGLGVKWTYTRFPPRTMRARLLIAGAGLWWAALGIWFAIRMIYGGRDEDAAMALLLAVCGPALAAAGLVALRWARAAH